MLSLSIDCGRCGQRLLPEGMEVYKSTPEFNEVTVPLGLLKDHSLKCGVWGSLVVLEGSLRFCEGALKVEVRPETLWYVLPGVSHNVEVVGSVRFRVDFLRSAGSTNRTSHSSSEASPE